MIIKLRPDKIAHNVMSDEEIAEGGAVESIYQIRKLKAAVLLSGVAFVVDEVNGLWQAYLDDFDVWINRDEYVVL